MAAVAAAAGGDGRGHRSHLRRGADHRAQAELRHGVAPAPRPRADDDHRVGQVGAAHPLGREPEGGRNAARVVDRLAAEWRATEATLAEIEAEIPYPLSQAVTDIEAALRRKSFHDRIAEKLADDPAWN